MGLTGRYDFKGIQKTMERLIDAFVVGTTWGAWLMASPFKPVIDGIEGLIINYFANRGLILLDLGAIAIDGKIDQAKLDAALDDAFLKMKVGRDKLTPEEGKAIDDEVREAFDQDADIGATNGADSMSDIPATSVRSGNNSPI